MENELEKKERVSQLLLIYGGLLTENIHHRMELFYLEDYSITEISQVENVSRNAIFESLSNGEKLLEKYEDCLCVYEKSRNMLTLLNQLSLEKDEEERKKLIQKLKGEIEYGI